MIKKVFEVIKIFGMLKNTDCVVIGVSGGLDSVSLLHFLLNIPNLKVVVAHVNHNLRGNESNRDEIFVKNLCHNLNIEFFSNSVNILEISKSCKIGIEECARDVRYSFLNEISTKKKAKIVTAHTLSDSIETIIFNLIRGTGLEGLCGIPPVRGNIIRPFIRVSRGEIKKYAEKNSIEYVVDSSNFLCEFSRNRIRNLVIPEFKKINTNFENNIDRFLCQIIEENKFLNEIAIREVSSDIEKINILPEAIKKRVLKLILKKFDKNVEFKHVKLANNLIKKQINAFSMSRNKKIKIKNKSIVCERINNVLTEKNKKFIISAVPKEEFFKFNCLERNYVSAFDLKEFNLSDLEFRNRMGGDFFCLPKRGCSKILKKLFNELKIPISERKNINLLAYRSEVIWIDLIGVSEKYKITDNTKLFGIIKEYHD
ncbi:MAG: tRNA lysidine(34) synthetase TilS [Firmicutes bacterium]|nr:tRNA lysidine(34) synthetase TilS [Bacillota bacterium]